MRNRSTTAARRGDIRGLPSQQSEGGTLSLSERHAFILEVGMQPFAGSWKERLQMELAEPALAALIVSTAESRREKLLRSHQPAARVSQASECPRGFLPMKEATSIFDEIVALYGVPIAERVSQSQVPVPPVPTAVLLQWRQQYDVDPVSP